MATGIVVGADPAAANAVDDAIGQASDAFHRGVRTLTYLAGPRTIEEFIAITQAEGGSEHVNADDPTPPANSSPTGSPTG
jgi:hypothetical protein